MTVVITCTSFYLNPPSLLNAQKTVLRLFIVCPCSRHSCLKVNERGDLKTLQRPHSHHINSHAYAATPHGVHILAQLSAIVHNRQGYVYVMEMHEFMQN